MARITDAELTRLKAGVPLARLVEAAGIELKAHGRDLVGRCPFHEDRTPSLVVSPDKNLWHCLGACGSGGSVVDWVMRQRQVSFRHAVELLRRELPGSALAASAEVPAPTRPDPAPSPDAEDAELLGRVVAYYHETLQQSPEALAYLDHRGLHDPNLITTFQLGYANRTLTYWLAEAGERQALRERLQALGVLRASGHEHLNGSLVIPITDAAGQLVQLYGRKLRDDLRPGTPAHLYLPGPQRGVFNAAGLQGQSEVILCEALLDALTFWAAGYRNVTAAYGVHGFTDEHLAAFKAAGLERVLIAYDRDAAGDQAAAALAERLRAAGIGCARVLFPKRMDANAYALKVQPAAKSLGLLLRTAEWLGHGKPARTAADAVSTVATVAARAAVPESPSEPVSQPAPPRVRDAAAVSAVVPDVPAAAECSEPVLPLPAQTPPALPGTATVTDREAVLAFGPRRYRLRGWQQNTGVEVLRVNVLVSAEAGLHVDSFDLYSARHRQAFAREAAAELGVEESVIQRDLGQVLLHLEGLQEARLAAVLQPQVPAELALSAEARTAALQLLKAPDLAERIVADFERVGLVGEPVNALIGYLAAVSRKLKAPLALIVQSTSAAGKSALMDAVLSLLPESDRIHYSAMTGQSLFYLGEKDLKHKVLAIAEEAGVRQAAYALKLLQSQGELTIASTGKDPATGKLVTEEYRVEGPVMLFLTTTAIDLDEELLNRCLVLTVNESREQTRRILAAQRAQRTLAGLLAGQSAAEIRALHGNAQRLLRPLAVVNPYAEQLTFLDERPRTRRDHQKYLTLIDAIALLHQHQRPVHTVEHQGKPVEYIEVTAADIALANRLAHEVLGRSLDELPPQTRRLLATLTELVQSRMARQALRRSEVRFTRREARLAAGLSDTQARLHLERLVELEYLLVHGGRNGQRFVYELLFDGEVRADTPRLPGLIEADTLTTTANLAGSEGHLAGGLRPAGGDLAASSRCPEGTVPLSVPLSDPDEEAALPGFTTPARAPSLSASLAAAAKG